MNSGGGGGGGGDPGGRLYTLEELDERVIPRAGGVRLTAEDVILLLLRADPHPIRGREALAAQVYLAVTGPLARSGVEPIAFRRGRGGRPRSAHVELALEHLAFTKNVSVSDGRGRRGGVGAEITITAKGRGRIAGNKSLPAAARSALARKRAEWAVDAPECRMEDATYVHNRELLERLPAPGGHAGGGGRKGAGQEAVPSNPHGGGRSTPPAGPAPDGYAEECYAEACALAAGGDHEAAIRLCERAILLEPSHAGSYRGKAGSLSALGRRKEAAKFHRMAALLEPNRAAAGGSKGDDAAASDAARASQMDGGPAAAPDAWPLVTVRFAPAPGTGRRHPRIRGFPSLAGALLGTPNEDRRVNVLTQFRLYRGEQLSQSDGIFAHNVINGLLTDLVFPLLLRALGDRPIPRDFALYAVQITMHSKEGLNDVLINEDIKMDLTCRIDKKGHKDGDEVLVGDMREIASIRELDCDPDAATISLLRINGSWLGKFDVIYNRDIVRQKLKRALKFLNDSIRDDVNLESRYGLLWSGCELLGESMLLLHNMLKPRSSHRQIRGVLGQLLRWHNFSYIEDYDEIARIRESLRYGPPHPDRSAEAKKKIIRLQDASMEFAAFAINFLGGRQVSAGNGDSRTAGDADPADAPDNGRRQ